jgi:hypothetical protein
MARLAVAIILLQTLFLSLPPPPKAFTSSQNGCRTLRAHRVWRHRTHHRHPCADSKNHCFWGTDRAGTMLGAILSHLFVLGIEVANDGGTLFVLATVTFFCCIFLLFQNRQRLPNLIKLKF